MTTLHVLVSSIQYKVMIDLKYDTQFNRNKAMGKLVTFSSFDMKHYKHSYWVMLS
jgi:hypothetical protein